MISTKDLSGLPNAERLKNFCKGLAALDIIMVEEEWSFIRHYTYNPAWRKGKEAFFATDGSDQSMIVMFAPEGCVINGEVENCVISKGVYVGEGAKLSNCIVMQDTKIGCNTNLNYVIIDKDVTIKDGRSLMGYDSYPIYIAKKSVV